MAAVSMGISAHGKTAAGAIVATMVFSSGMYAANYSTVPSYFFAENSMQGISNASILPIYYEMSPAVKSNIRSLLPYQSILLEMKDKIQEYFPNTPVSIEENFDENGIFCGLYVGIHAQMPVHEAMRKFDQFDDTYIVPNTERLEGIVIDVVC